MVYQTLNDIFNYGKLHTKKRLAVAAAHDSETLKSIVKAKDEGGITPILIGDLERIRTLLTELGEQPDEYQLIDAIDDNQSAAKAVALVKNQQADLLMKGHLDTAILLKAVVNKEQGIAISSTLSHINLMELEGYHKLFIMTDVAIVIEPTLKQKQDIISNAVRMLKKLGYVRPKVAVLSAIEKLNPKMSETVDAETLKQMNQRNEIKDCLVEGPLSFDIAMNSQRAERKNYQGEIKGDADILVVPNLVAGNLLAKSLSLFGHAKAVGFVSGAKVPIVLTSRGATAEAKYNSILTCLAIL